MKATLAKALVSTAMELHGRSLWLRVPPDTAIEVRVPGEEHPLAVVVMGHGGGEHGLLALRGPHAFELAARMASGEQSQRLRADLEFVSSSVEPWSALPEPARVLLLGVGQRALRDQLVPSFLAKRGESLPRPPGAHDAEVLLACMQAFVAAEEQGVLTRQSFENDPDRMLSLVVTGSTFGPSVATSWVPRRVPRLHLVTNDDEDGDEDEYDVAVTFADVVGPKPVLAESTWWAGYVPIAHSPRGPSSVHLLVLDLNEDAVRTFRAVREDLDDEERLIDAHVALLKGVAGKSGLGEKLDCALPREFVFGDAQLAGEFEAELVELGVEVRFEPRRPDEVTAAIERITDALHDGFEEILSRARGGEAAKQRARAPRLQNTDGDLLAPSNSAFELSDPKQFARDLVALDDVDPLEPGKFVWFREHVPSGRTTLLGRIEVRGKQAFLEVNSEERFERARTWLEQIPGTRFQSRRMLEVPDPSDLLATPKAPLTPEKLAILGPIVEATYLAQLDEPNRSLGNRTPREVSRDPATRAQVERWIRSLPEVNTPGGWQQPPRERLRRELGLAPPSI